MTKPIIFRDDDIGQWTKLQEFKKVHEVFMRYGVIHTIAVICNGLDKCDDLINYLKLKQSSFSVQLHCFDHLDFSTLSEQELNYQFTESLKMFELIGIEKPVTWFPPWNKINTQAIRVAESFGFKASWEKVSMEYYLRHNGDVGWPVVNFHSWYVPEQMLVEPCLKVYTNQ